MVRKSHMAIDWALAGMMITAALVIVPFQIWMLIHLGSLEEGIGSWVAATFLTLGVWLVPDFGLFGIFLPATVLQAIQTTRKYNQQFA